MRLFCFWPTGTARRAPATGCPRSRRSRSPWFLFDWPDRLSCRRFRQLLYPSVFANQGAICCILKRVPFRGGSSSIPVAVRALRGQSIFCGSRRPWERTFTPVLRIKTREAIASIVCLKRPEKLPGVLKQHRTGSRERSAPVGEKPRRSMA